MEGGDLHIDTIHSHQECSFLTFWVRSKRSCALVTASRPIELASL